MGAFPRFAQSHTNVSATHVVALDSQVAVGDVQYAMVESSGSTTAHTWPAGWTVVFNAAAGPGRVSVAKRVRVAGDANPTVSGGVNNSWASSAFALKASGPNAASVAAEASQTNAASVSVLTAALASGDAHPTGIYMIACTLNNTITAQYPLISPVIDTLDTTAPPVLILPYSQPTIPAFTLTQSGASPSVAYCIAAITTPAGIYSAESDLEGDYVRWEGYNKYPQKLAALGGGISVT